VVESFKTLKTLVETHSFYRDIQRINCTKRQYQQKHPIEAMIQTLFLLLKDGHSIEHLPPD